MKCFITISTPTDAINCLKLGVAVHYQDEKQKFVFSKQDNVFVMKFSETEFCKPSSHPKQIFKTTNTKTLENTINCLLNESGNLYAIQEVSMLIQ